MNWSALTRDFSTQILSAQNLLISLVSYPLLKSLHELMHGYLAKKRGAEIREMGIMFLVFFPVPYLCRCLGRSGVPIEVGPRGSLGRRDHR